jgi:hypothetical protein
LKPVKHYDILLSMLYALSRPSNGTTRFLVPMPASGDPELPTYAIVLAMGTPGVVV